MTAAPSEDGTSVSPAFPPELLYALTETIVLAPDATTRATVIDDLVQHITACLDWLHSGDTSPDDELTSVRAIVSAAQAHLMRMTGPDQRRLLWALSSEVNSR